MLNLGAFPWKDWATGELVTEQDFQNFYDACHNADKKPFNLNLYKNYIWWKNTKDLHTMSAWDGTTGYTTVSADSTSAMTNDLAIRSTVNGTIGNVWCGFYNDPWSTQNMLQMNEGVTLTASQVNVVINFYVNDITKWERFRFRFGDDGSNFYYFTVESSALVSGWNQKIYNLAYVSTTGSPSGWDNITYFYCYGYGINSNINGAFWILDNITLVKNDVNNYPYPLQVSNGNALSETWSNLSPSLTYYMQFTNDLYVSGHELGIIRTAEATNLRWLQLDNNTYKEFYAKVRMKCKDEGKSNGLCFYVDTLNYVQLYVSSSVLTLDTVIGGVTTTKTATLDTTLLKNWEFELKLFKTAETIFGEITGLHIKPRSLNTYVASTEEGTLNISTPIENGMCLIKDWTVSHNPTAMVATETGVI